MTDKNLSRKVLVAMSGGVDSAVAAAILKNQGYEVTGVFLRFWKEKEEDKNFENKCCSLEAYEDLKKIGKVLGIKILTVNAEKEFKKEVVEYFLREYKNGRTPNPCVVCNREIKFKLLLKKMLEMEADYIASGHYARKLKIKNQKSKIKIKENFIYKLFPAKDKDKDQSYFLYTLNQKQLARILFPLGDYKKSEVRKMAEKFKLPVFDKKESQDICFISSDVAGFLKKHLKLKKGKIVNEKGNILGQHQGLALYTPGQRKGINVGGSGPYFVVGKDSRKNILIITNNSQSPALTSKEIMVENVNWTTEKSKLPAKMQVRTRYRNPLVSAIIKAHNAKRITQSAVYKIEFDKPQRAMASGQSAVLYGKNGEVLGGGGIR
jgi:tRNA-uridine 2-sulfurtransferase